MCWVCRVSWSGGGRRGRRTNLGMEDMAQIGGLVAGHGREAEVVNPTFI